MPRPKQTRASCHHRSSLSVLHQSRPDNPDPCGVPSSKTERTKRRNESVSSDHAGLTYPNIVLGLWPVYCRISPPTSQRIIEGPTRYIAGARKTQLSGPASESD